MRTTDAPTLPRLLALTLAIAGGCLLAPPAHAAGCVAAFDGATHVLTIHNCTADPDAPVTARIARTAAGAIQLDGKAIAGGPTVASTDAIVYSGAAGATDEITVDMTEGPFAPGRTLELVGRNEIELSVDGGGGGNFLTILGDDTVSDRVDVGAGGIDLTDDGDSDINGTNIAGRLLIDGQGGNDRLSGKGFGGSAPTAAPLELRGGDGFDVLTGGSSSDALHGGDGVDAIIDGRGGGFTLTPTTLTGHGTDTVAGIEAATLTGGSGPDTIDASAFDGFVALIGYAGDDILLGASGHDDLRGHVGDDVVDGGAGNDAVTEHVAGDATLTDGSLTGAGSDTLASIERAGLYGGDAAQRIDASGFGGRALIVAAGGDDSIAGGRGADSLHGGDGSDALTGGLGMDTLHGDAGDDRAFSADGVLDQVGCGDGTDAAFADEHDGLQACEQIDRGGAPAEPGEEPAPPPAPAVPGTPAPDAVAPALSRLSVARARLRFTLSEPARVTFTIWRAAPGRRYVRLRGRLVHRGVAGANVVALRGRALARGRYRLVARAVDAAGNRSAARRAAFRVAARRR